MSGSERELGDGGHVPRDPVRQRRAGAVQRVAWAVLAVLVLAALAGLFGPGPLSRVSATDPAGLVRLEHERFTRYAGDTDLRVQVRPGPGRDGTAAFWISAAYLSQVRVQQVQPQPVRWTTSGDRALLEFAVSGPDPVTVVLQLRPDEVGLLRGAVGVPGGEPIGFWQLVYP
ncbi:hypothetical protein SAMN05216207_101681 [Pseudonocardia ammonioxydans]|uniref:Uncharacterized protein n=1 Tax=Pseudonocardia ammonioxydans TaxID=260086 RepID=A0A1I4ZY73_PSUAM|nr:hypothetical protein [Pseudonocardia ammonioxydans]SFN55131.1 hypothetical protein SAMN05216207_101681 [Pseudonocardia ammonioxydans]